jgi:hypothetical protein
MDKDAVKDIIFGGLVEIVKSKRYYRYSTVGPEYSYLTEDGEKMIVEYINLMSYKIHQAEEEELNKRAKELTMKALKGETV